MSEFRSEEFFPVYVKCLRPEHPLSFDCYILLRQSNRIILWVRKNESLSQNKFEKLQGHSMDKIYVRVEDKQTYFGYLDNFLTSEEGEVYRKEILENKDYGKIEGLPDQSEYKLKSLSSPAQDFGKITVEDEIDGPIGDVIRAIKSEVSDLEKTAVRGLIKELSDRKVIEDCTLHINDELIRVEDKLTKNNVIDPETINGLSRHFREQIAIIKGSLDQPENKLLRQMAETIETEMQELNAHSESKNFNPRILRKRLRSLKGQIASFAQVAKENPHAMVSKTVSQMIRQVEKTLGQRISLDPQVGMYDEIPEYMSARLNLDDVMTAASDDVKIFQHQIIKQQLLIQDLNKKYQTNCQELKALRDKWYVFQIQAKKNLSGGDMLMAKEIDKEFQKFEVEFNDLKANSDTLHNVSNKLTDDMGGDHIAVDSQLLADIGAISKDVARGVETAPGENAPTNLGDIRNVTSEDGASLSDDTVLTVESGPLQTENEVLKAQLENSQKLIDASNLKIEELVALNEKNSQLSNQLEEQNAEYFKLNTGLEEKVEMFQTAEDTYNDTLDNLNNQLKASQNEIENYKETVANLQQQANLTAKELQLLKDNKGLDEIVKAKDDEFKKIQNSLAIKQEEIRGLKTEVNSLTGKLNEAQQKYKHLSHKMDRAAGEIEALKKTSRAAQTKSELSANSLQQMRKTVSKLTEIADQLRKDRQTYILKTNEAMLKYETMTTEASSLNRKVEANSQIRSDLEDKLKQAKKIEKKLRGEIRNLKNELYALQEQAKKIA